MDIIEDYYLRAFQCNSILKSDIKIKCMFDLLNLSKTVLICKNISIDAENYNLGDVQMEIGWMEAKHNVYRQYCP